MRSNQKIKTPIGTGTLLGYYNSHDTVIVSFRAADLEAEQLSNLPKDIKYHPGSPCFFGTFPTRQIEEMQK